MILICKQLRVGNLWVTQCLGQEEAVWPWLETTGSQSQSEKIICNEVTRLTQQHSSYHKRKWDFLFQSKLYQVHIHIQLHLNQWLGDHFTINIFQISFESLTCCGRQKSILTWLQDVSGESWYWCLNPLVHWAFVAIMMLVVSAGLVSHHDQLIYRDYPLATHNSSNSFTYHHIKYFLLTMFEIISTEYKGRSDFIIVQSFNNWDVELNGFNHHIHIPPFLQT